MVETERCSVVVVLRDRYSTTERCLDAILKNTPGMAELIAVLGDTPAPLRSRWAAVYGPRVRFIFPDRLLNPSEYRNIGLREASTRLAVLMDNDVFVRPGWLEALVNCQAETGASLVVPLVLESPTTIHTAGNELLVTYKDGVAYGQKELRYAKLTHWKDTSLKRASTDYGELHCQLVVREKALALGVYDERLREVGEVDCGLTWAKAGEKMFFEPGSVVVYDFPGRITRREDVKPYLYKWDMIEILKGYEHFRQKWNMDIGECGTWKDFNAMFLNKVGLLSKLWPVPLTIAADNAYYIGKNALARPLDWWRNAKKAVSGYYHWK